MHFRSTSRTMHHSLFAKSEFCHQRIFVSLNQLIHKNLWISWSSSGQVRHLALLDLTLQSLRLLRLINPRFLESCRCKSANKILDFLRIEIHQDVLGPLKSVHHRLSFSSLLSPFKAFPVPNSSNFQIFHYFPDVKHFWKPCNNSFFRILFRENSISRRSF